MKLTLRFWPPLVLALIAGIAWLIRYALLVGLDPTRQPMWSGWFDQGKYRLSASALAHLDFATDQHWYPPAYSLVASPFTWLIPAQPFLIPDLLLFVVSAAAFGWAMRPLGIGRWLATAIFILSTLAPIPAADLWTEPWTTTLSAALIWSLIAVVAHQLFTTPPDGQVAANGPWLLVATGALAAALPATRPADALVSACALGFAAIFGWQKGLVTIRNISLIVVGGLAFAVPYLSLYLAIYGPHVSGYISAAQAQGFAFGDLPWKAYVLLITPQPWFPDCRSLIERLPWLVPGCAGLVTLAVIAKAGERRALALLLVIALPYCAVQLAYTDLQPSGLWRYQNAHYFKWLFPLAGAGLWFWLRAFGVWRHWAIAMAATIAFMLVACFRVLPTPIADDQPARMLMFKGNMLRAWSEAYFASVVIRDDAGTQVNVGNFHQIPDEHGERAISIDRPFAAHAMRHDPGEPAPFQGWQAPYARYGERVSFGWPCWLRPADCRLPQSR